MYRSVIFSIIFLFITSLVWGNPTMGQQAQYARSDEEGQILTLVNRERSRRGLSSLSWSDRLADLAREYSRKMARERFFDHIDREGNDVVQRAKFSRIRGWNRIGENLFMCNDTDQFVTLSVRGWMRSPSHRENILDPDWRTTGIGVAYSRNGDIFITQVFAD